MQLSSFAFEFTFASNFFFAAENVYTHDDRDDGENEYSCESSGKFYCKHEAIMRHTSFMINYYAIRNETLQVIVREVIDS